MTNSTTTDQFNVQLTIEQIDQIETALLLYQDELNDAHKGNPEITNQLIIDRNLAERAGKPKPEPVQFIDKQNVIMEDIFKVFQAVKEERQRRFDALLNDTTRTPEGDESQF